MPTGYQNRISGPRTFEAVADSTDTDCTDTDCTLNGTSYATSCATWLADIGQAVK